MLQTLFYVFLLYYFLNVQCNLPASSLDSCSGETFALHSAMYASSITHFITVYFIMMPSVKTTNTLIPKPQYLTYQV